VAEAQASQGPLAWTRRTHMDIYIKRGRVMGSGSDVQVLFTYTHSMSPTKTRWQRSARTLRTLENRLDQVGSYDEAMHELLRFKATRCGARTRLGRPCRRKKLPNGRCRNHGGMSTGPRTPEGLRRSLQNLKQYRSTV
jgi:hypothetical protein